jgi:hypothetical protein
MISSLFRGTLTKKHPFIRQGARQMHEQIIVLTEMTDICRNDIVLFIICGKSAPFWQKMSIHPEQYRLVHYGQAQKGVASHRA